MTKGLIIGASSGIGQAILKMARSTGSPAVGEWLAPGRDELDVRWPHNIFNYILANGPFSYIVYSAGVNALAWVRHLGYPGTILGSTWDVNCAGFIHIVGCHERQFPSSWVSAVAISSDGARRPMRGSVAYCSSKAALDMAVKTMARELAPRWRINAISPGITEGTEMTRYLDEAIPEFRQWNYKFAREYELSQIPMGRRGTTDEIAAVALTVLNGPEYMTGAIIEVNGGR